MALSYSDLFDFDGYKSAIKDITQSNKEFSASLKDLASSIKSSLGETRGTLDDIAAGFSKFNVSGRGAREQLVAMSKDSEVATQRFREQQDAVTALTNVQDLSTRAVKELKKAAASLKDQYDSLGGSSADLNAKKEVLAKEFQRVTAAIKEQSKVLAGVTPQIKVAADSYKGMQQELTSVGNALKTMSNAFDPVTGKINQNNAAAVALQKRYIELNTTVKAIDSGLGNFQRNVGNYGGAFEATANAFKKGFSIIRQAANILPGLGLGGAFLLLFEGIKAVLGVLIETEKEINKLGASNTALKKAFAGEEFKKAVTDVNELQTAIELSKQGYLNSDDVIKKYNETIGKTTGLVHSLAEAESELAKKGNEYIRFTLLKAAANVALQKSAEKVADAEIKSRETAQSFIPIIGDALPQSFLEALTTGNPGLDIAAAERQQKKIAEAKKQSGTLLDIFKDFQKQAADIAKANGFNFLSNNKEDPAAERKALNEYERALRERQKALKEEMDAENLLNQDRLDRQEISEVQFAQFKYNSAVKYNQAASALEKQVNKVGYKAKENQLKEFNNVELKANGEFDKAIVKAGKDVEKSHLEAKQKAIEDAANFEIASIKDAEQYELANKRLTNEARVRLEIQYLDKIDEITIKSLQDRAALELDAAKRAALLTQATSLRAGINTRDAFGNNISIPKATAQDNIKDLLEREAKLKSLGVLTIEQEISIAKEIISIRESVGEDTAADEQKLFDLRAKKAAQYVDFIKASAVAAGQVLGDGVTKAFDDIIDGFEKIRKGGELTFADIAQFGIDAGNAITQNYKSGIEDQISALDQQKAYELKQAGNNAAAQAAIEAKYQKETAQLKRKEAIADRENAVFQIAINTAVAAVKALPNVFLSGLIIAFGALETALVLSKPLPKFAKGTESAPEGWAEVDEMGTELIINKHGRLKEVGTDSGPRYTYLERGDKVKTATNTKKILANMESEAILREIGLNGRLASSLSKSKQNEAVLMLAKAIEHNSGAINTDRIVSAIKNIPIHQTLIDEKGQRKRIKQGLHTNTLLNQYTLSR